MTPGAFNWMPIPIQPAPNKAFSRPGHVQLTRVKKVLGNGSCRLFDRKVSLCPQKKKLDAGILSDASGKEAIAVVISKLESLQMKPADRWKLKRFPTAFSAIRSALEHNRSGTYGLDVAEICAQLFMSLYSQYAKRIIRNRESSALHLSKLVILADEFHLLFEPDFKEEAGLLETVTDIVQAMRERGWFSVAKNSPQQFSRHDACLFLNSCVSLGFWNRAMDHFVTKHFFLELIRSDLHVDEYEELSKSLFAAFSRIKPPSIVRILRALGHPRKKYNNLSVKCINLLVQDTLRAVQDQVARGNRAWLKTPCASYLCWTVAKCHHADLTAMNIIISARLETLKAQRKQMSATELACLVHSTAILNIHFPEVVESATEFLKSNVETIDHTNGGRLLWGLSVHGELTEAQFYYLVWLMMRNKKGSLKENSGTMLVVAQSYVFLDVAGRLSKKVGMPYSQKCRQIINVAKTIRKEALHTTASKLQMDVLKLLDEDLKLKVTAEKSLLDGHVTTDIHVEDSNLVVEVDGPTHYTSNKVDGMYHLLGKTVFRNRLLNLAGFKVLSVPHYKWNKLGRQSRKKWLKDAISDMEATNEVSMSPQKKKKTKTKNVNKEKSMPEKSGV